LHFVLYSEKSAKQCLSAINERLQMKGSKSRPELEGWIDKNGEFLIAMSSNVARRFTRRTQLHARVERDEGITTITGFVSDGANRQGQAIIFGALLLVALLFLLKGNALIAIFAVLAGAALYIPLNGDYNNSAVLMKELRRTLQARDNPPKKQSQARKL
jgi:hypothetical protein